MKELIKNLIGLIASLKKNIQLLEIEDITYDHKPVISKLQEIEDYYSTFIEE